MLPTAMAEAVLASRHSAELSRAAESELQHFIALLPERLSSRTSLPEQPQSVASTSETEPASTTQRPAAASRPGHQHTACSTVVTGAIMTAFESAQRWPEVCSHFRTWFLRYSSANEQPGSSASPHLLKACCWCDRNWAVLKHPHSQVLRLFCKAQQEGLQPSLAMFNAALLSLAKTGAYEVSIA